MKNRNIPYGYQYENGAVVIHPEEARIFKQIVRQYHDGLSLLKIAEQLNAEQAEYMPGVVGWNKSRLMRLITDERYLGTDIYPSLIDSDMRDTLLSIRDRKNTQKNTDRQADIFTLDVLVICPACGSEMRRRHDSRCKCQQRWACKNQECGTLIAISDDELLERITARLNTVISNPDIIRVSESSMEPSMEVRHMEHEISRMLDSFGFDKDILLKKMMECTSFKYREIDKASRISKRLKADFEKSSPLSNFSAELCSRTVKSVLLDTDGTVGIILTNDQRIGKEQ